MGPDFWAAVAAIAAAMSAIVTLVIAYANASQMRTANQTSDFVNCLAVVSDLGEAQRRVSNAKDSAQRTFEFNELLNLMEALAGLHNDGKLTASTKKITEEFLDEVWAQLSASPATMALVANTITSPTTFIELSRFAKRPGSRVPEYITRQKKQMTAVGAEQSGTPLVS